MNTSARISQKSFLQSVFILFALMLFAGILTRLVPAGRYTRVFIEGREAIDPDSFLTVTRPDYPVWRWFTAPLEVLWGSDGIVIITILVFLILVGAAFTVLANTGILQDAVSRITSAAGGHKYLLLITISFFFMAAGAFFGLFEEVVPLMPFVVVLAYSLGWDVMVGLGMSVLATNMGFSAAITNPFTIGVAQKLAGLPLFSGAWLRGIIFLSIYMVFILFLIRYARRIEQIRERLIDHQADRNALENGAGLVPVVGSGSAPRLSRALGVLGGILILIAGVLVSTPFVPAVAEISMPVVGLLFFFGSIGAGLVSETPVKRVFTSAGEGIVSVIPAIPLILMAASVKHIVFLGGIMDTLLHSAAEWAGQASTFLAALLVYGFVLALDFFISSGSAKAFLIMPILLPLADLIGVTHQITVMVYSFGDGFSNLAYPTSPVLLICLGLTGVSYPRWLKWTLGLWPWVLLVTILFIGIGVLIGWGPF